MRTCSHAYARTCTCYTLHVTRTYVCTHGLHMVTHTCHTRSHAHAHDNIRYTPTVTLNQSCWNYFSPSSHSPIPSSSSSLSSLSSSSSFFIHQWPMKKNNNNSNNNNLTTNPSTWQGFPSLSLSLSLFSLVSCFSFPPTPPLPKTLTGPQVFPYRDYSFSFKLFFFFVRLVERGCVGGTS